MANIIVSNLVKSFPHGPDKLGNRIEVIRDISLQVKTGELITFFGPNGCGKSTLIHTIGGLMSPDSGSIQIDGLTVQESKMGFVFQNYRETLFPWLNSIENVAFPLTLASINKKQRLLRVRDFVKNFNIQLDETSFPYQQSGGQQQLLSILRALIYQPDLVLLDEPFAALDYTTRISIQDTVLNLFSQTSATALFISHEIDEAIYMADRLVLLSRRPASILKIVDIDLDRPRRRSMLATEKFARIRSHVVQQFQEALKK